MAAAATNISPLRGWLLRRRCKCFVSRRAPERAGGGLADGVRGAVERADGDEAEQFVVADGLEPRRGEAAALRAVGRAAELAGLDAALQVGREVDGGAREDALVGRARRAPEAPQDRVRQIDLRGLCAQR